MAVASKPKQNKVPRRSCTTVIPPTSMRTSSSRSTSRVYDDTADPYRFKKGLVWTNTHRATMEGYINPAHAYHTDGQIVGR
jgi:hypothetical protein